MNIVEIKGLCYNYGSKKVLKDLDLTLEGGRVTGLLGPNGAGKTTLIKVLAGLLQSYQGGSADQWTSYQHRNEGIGFLSAGENLFQPF